MATELSKERRRLERQARRIEEDFFIFLIGLRIFFEGGGGGIALLFEIFLLRRDVVMLAGFER